MMKEIGGYIEIEHYTGKMLHENAVLLNSGRCCLAYLIENKNISTIWLPYYICDSVIDTCLKYNVKINFYHILRDFTISDVNLEGGDYLYVVNYFGQLKDNYIKELKDKYINVILDNSHAYFNKPIYDIDTLYTCRKYFGVADGGILYTNIDNKNYESAKSYDKYEFLLGRYEIDASTFYKTNISNNNRFENDDILFMSKVTKNFLKSFDYDSINNIRKQNFGYLNERLKNINQLDINDYDGPFMYPLLVSNGSVIKKKLIENKIYVPTLWPNVLENIDKNSYEYYLANNLILLPVDQRYNNEDMDNIIKILFNIINECK